MIHLFWIAGGILALVWVGRLLDAALGMPSVPDISRPKWAPQQETSTNQPRISIIVPARNEEQDIAATLQRLLTLDYEHYEVIAVNDRSTDRTGAIMDQIAAQAPSGHPLRVIHIADLPPGWLGKPHAMWTASQQATGDWLLFTDADVLFKPDVLRRVLAYAASQAADHVVLFPQMIMHTPGERMMIAFFQTMFVFGHRPWKVADPKAKDHMGVGAFNMVRRDVYNAVGGFQTLRMEILDDMKLGKLVKEAGYVQRCVFGRDLISIRWIRGTLGLIENMSKNSFAVLSFQPWRVLGSCFLLAFLHVGPFLGIWLAHGWARLPFAIALACVFGVYVGMSWKSPIPPYYFIFHPIGAAASIYVILQSMLLAITRGGIVWRGTFYPLQELREGMK